MNVKTIGVVSGVVIAAAAGTLLLKPQPTVEIPVVIVPPEKH